MKLFLCRHGETEWSLSGQHTGKTDLSLTRKGREEAEKLRESLKREKFERVFTSPLKRAKETCEGMGAEEDPLLMEWDYGAYEGLTIHEIRKGWDLFTEGAPDGESPQEVAKRADAFLRKIKGIEGNVAIFSHGHFLRVLAVRFLGQEVVMAKHFVLSVASVSTLGYERQEPAILTWNCAS